MSQVIAPVAQKIIKLANPRYLGHSKMTSPSIRLLTLSVAGVFLFGGCGWGNNVWNNGNSPYGCGCNSGSCGPAPAGNGYYTPQNNGMPGWRAPTSGAPSVGNAP
ncbi:MAG: hypothetical protein ACO1RA_13000 [Planctomycetaceae bacterium]